MVRRIEIAPHHVDGYCDGSVGWDNHAKWSPHQKPQRAKYRMEWTVKDTGELGDGPFHPMQIIKMPDVQIHADLCGVHARSYRNTAGITTQGGTVREFGWRMDIQVIE